MTSEIQLSGTFRISSSFTYIQTRFKINMLFIFFATLTNDKNVESKKAELAEIENRILSSRSLEGWRGKTRFKSAKLQPDRINQILHILLYIAVIAVTCIVNQIAQNS